MRHLRLVSVLGRELNISRSADLLHTTQPALSRSLAELEGLVGMRLFDRTTKRVSPTAAGLVLMQHANRILAELEGAEKQLEGIHSGIRGGLRVGIVPSISSRLLASAIARLRQMLPEVAVSVQTLGLGALYSALLDRRVDLMLAPVELGVDLQAVRVEEAYSETTSVLAAAGHPLAGLKKVTDAQLAEHAWVLPSPELPTRPRLNRMLALHRLQGSRSVRDIEADSFALAVELVRTAGLLSFLPTRLVGEIAAAEDLVVLDTEQVLMTGSMCALRLRDATEGIAGDTLLQCLRDLADAPPD